MKSTLLLAGVTASLLLISVVGCDKPGDTPVAPAAPTAVKPVTPSATMTATTMTATATGEAAAQSMIDSVKAYIAKGDFTKAKEVLAQLKAKGVYDALPQTMKDTIDNLSKSIPAGDLPGVPKM